jgi:Mg/Co/Ni transporter MgtE
MIYKQKFYYLCKTPLSAEGPQDVEVIDRADDSNSFPELFKHYEKLRSHAFNEDNLYSIVRADDIFELVRTGTEKEAKEMAFERAEPEIITNLQHRVMQKNDKNAKAILKEVHQIEA